MDLLDDNLEYASNPTEESIAKIRKLRLDYDAEAKHIKNAKTATIVVSVLTAIQILMLFTQTNDPWVLGVSTLLLFIYIGCAMAPIEHARITLTIISVLYGINLLAALLSGSVLIMIFSFLVRGFILYFMVRGAVSAFKLHEILKQMKVHNVTPYQY